MSQAAEWGVKETSPETPGAHAVRNNDSLDAILSQHLGASRPSYAVQGTIWNKDLTASSPPLIETYHFDGTDDILIFTTNISANTIEFSGLETVAKLDIANIFTKTQTWQKGSDVASTGSLVLGDGNYFDITGTTAITSIGTKGVGTEIKLHFDAALTLTHNAADLILPGAANITTAAGDEAIFMEYAAGDWRCVNYQIAANAPDGGGGAWNLIGTVEASDDASLTITGIDSTYDQYAIGFADLVPDTEAVRPLIRCGAGSIDSGASDYSWLFFGDTVSSTTFLLAGDMDDADSAMQPTNALIGTGVGDGFSTMIMLNRPTDGNMMPTFSGASASMNITPDLQGESFFGARNSVISLDRVQFFFSSGLVATGRLSVWGISHA